MRLLLGVSFRVWVARGRGGPARGAGSLATSKANTQALLPDFRWGVLRPAGWLLFGRRSGDYRRGPTLVAARCPVERRKEAQVRETRSRGKAGRRHSWRFQLEGRARSEPVHGALALSTAHDYVCLPAGISKYGKTPKKSCVAAV